jgi:hypothetical protein
MFAAIRRASSLVSNLAADRRPDSSSKIRPTPAGAQSGQSKSPEQGSGFEKSVSSF